jgi:hypothetical protein
VVLDMDSTEIAVYGDQEQSTCTGYFESTCYHPLLLFNGGGDCLGAKLRPGNVASAEGWEELLLPEIERQQAAGKGSGLSRRRRLRQARDLRGTGATEGKIRDSASRQRQAGAPHRAAAEAPVGRPSYRPLVCYQSFLYQAASWRRARVVAKVEFHFGELFPRVGFISGSGKASRRLQ